MKLLHDGNMDDLTGWTQLYYRTLKLAIAHPIKNSTASNSGYCFSWAFLQ